ncbi:MAG: type II toxin-antitoxin system YafQ family toxin [Bacteroidales bacterium]|nr:type II toxin-antitoxin system YafQ family toxin [Candidatus Cryptobacteroides onthequi]
MYSLSTTRQFEKDLKRCMKRGLPMEELRTVISILVENGELPAKYKPHKLSGNHAGEWECHIKPNWLLIWEQNDQELTLLMLNTGTHSDIFKK